MIKKSHKNDCEIEKLAIQFWVLGILAYLHIIFTYFCSLKPKISLTEFYIYLYFKYKVLSVAHYFICLKINIFFIDVFS